MGNPTVKAAPEPTGRPEILTREEAAKYLRVSLTTLKELVNRRRLKRFKDGRMVRFRLKDIEAYVESKTREKR